ncbi:MAG: 2-C-methyl-D-erythritol 4-phosphate cytidylyltransferase [Deltaproteobacteria bacterium]|nr:MAG: 2-C-methyl-D-erythritol 4-phosphate cytidylyltransferase [Deltaproteobacteria bacterium]
MNIQVIIPAAGSGKRFGGKKQFLSLWDKPVLLHSLECFEKSSQVTGVIVVTSEDEIDLVQTLIQRSGLKKVHAVIPGGKERQDSVRLGFYQAPLCDMVLVHDAARPFVSLEMIDRLVQGVQEVGAAVVGIPVKDTLKNVAGGLVKETVDRNPLWSIQTPQAIRYDIFKKAVELSQKENFLGTDESMLVEKAGFPVKIVMGSAYNFKITTPEDLAIAEALKGVLCTR